MQGRSGTEEITDHDTVPDWHALDAVGDIMAEQLDAASKTGRPQMLEMTLDSGAAKIVAPPTFAPGYAVKPSPGSRGVAKYVQDGEREHRGQPGREEHHDGEGEGNIRIGRSQVSGASAGRLDHEQGIDRPRQ